MTVQLGERTRAAAVRPHPYPFQQWTIAILLLMAPIFAVLYWLTVPTGSWLPVAVAQAALTLFFGLAVISYYLTAIWVDDTGLTTRDVFGRRRTYPVDGIGGVVRLDLYRSGSLDVRPQLFIVDRDGRLLIRMHGTCWEIEAMDAVANALGVPVTQGTEPLTLRDLSQSRPELLHWFERRFAALSVDY